MNRIFTIAFFILWSSSLFATAEFFMKINSNGNYIVSLDNQTLTTSSGIFRFFDLSNGNYQLKVMENNYNGRVVFNQSVFINNGFRIVAELDPYNGLTILHKLPLKQTSWFLDVVQYNPPTCGTPVPNCPKPCYPKPPKNKCNNGNGWNSNNHNNYGNGWNNTPNQPYNFNNIELTDADLERILQSMKNASFEEKKIEVAKSALKDRQLNTNQVHQLLDEITFEKNKLDLAKYCYDRTIDKNNYYTLYDDFAFSNYSTQLDKYIHSK